MERKNLLRLATGGTLGLVAIGATAFALAPERRGLASLDIDGDGQIVNNEVQQSARQRFAEHDSNNDGRLTGAELPRGRHGGGHHGRRHGGSEDAVSTAPGSVTQPQSETAPAPATAADRAFAPVPAQPQRLRRGFADADQNGDGAIDLREFYARHAARVARADRDEDGILSAEELAAHRSRRGRHRD